MSDKPSFKMYGIEIKRVSTENKVGNKQQIKPIKQLTQNLLYWENKERIIGNLYKQVYNETKSEIFAELSKLNDDDLLRLAKESEEERNFLLFDICIYILNQRFDNITLEELLKNFVNRDIGLGPYYHCWSFLRDKINKKVKQLNDEELECFKQYCHETYWKSIVEQRELMKNRFTVDEYFLIKDKSIEEKRKALAKIEKNKEISNTKIFCMNFMKRSMKT